MEATKSFIMCRLTAVPAAAAVEGGVRWELG